MKKKFVEQEAKIIRQRAELETKLKAIKIEEEIETRQAEVSALRENGLDLNLPAEDIVSRIQLYIDSLPRAQPIQHHGSYLAPFQQTLQELHQGSPPMQVRPTRLFHEPQQQPNAQIADSLPDLPEFSSSPLPTMLPETNQHVANNDSQSRAPMVTQMINSPMNQANAITCMDMTKFLLKTDLILSRITKFDNNRSLFLT